MGVAQVPSRRPCAFCGAKVPPAVAACPSCGGLREDDRPSDYGRGERKDKSRRKARADLLFLIGLLIGGPVMTIGGRVQLGLFLVLAGAFASALRRYSSVSLSGTLLMGGLGAAVVAAAVTEPPQEPMADDTQRIARSTFVQELDTKLRTRGGRVEGRGPELESIWFFLPGDEAFGECGAVPDEPTRDHLASIGVRRVVISDPVGTEGICSYEP